MCSTNLIQNLEDKVNFYKILTGLEVLNQEITKNGDIVTCRQHGRLGSNNNIFIINIIIL